MRLLIEFKIFLTSSNRCVDCVRVPMIPTRGDCKPATNKRIQKPDVKRARRIWLWGCCTGGPFHKCLTLLAMRLQWWMHSKNCLSFSLIHANKNRSYTMGNPTRIARLLGGLVDDHAGIQLLRLVRLHVVGEGRGVRLLGSEHLNEVFVQLLHALH